MGAGMKQTIQWKKTLMIGWNRYEGNSQGFGPYIIEKEDERVYSIWWGGVDIGTAENVQGAKSIALKHCRSF